MGQVNMDYIEEQLRQLDLELEQEEITLKGYEKKKAILLSQRQKQLETSASDASGSRNEMIEDELHPRFESITQSKRASYTSDELYSESISPPAIHNNYYQTRPPTGAYFSMPLPTHPSPPIRHIRPAAPGMIPFAVPGGVAPPRGPVRAGLPSSAYSSPIYVQQFPSGYHTAPLGPRPQFLAAGAPMRPVPPGPPMYMVPGRPYPPHIPRPPMGPPIPYPMGIPASISQGPRYPYPPAHILASTTHQSSNMENHSKKQLNIHHKSKSMSSLSELVGTSSNNDQNTKRLSAAPSPVNQNNETTDSQPRNSSFLATISYAEASPNKEPRTRTLSMPLDGYTPVGSEIKALAPETLMSPPHPVPAGNSVPQCFIPSNNSNLLSATTSQHQQGQQNVINMNSPDSNIELLPSTTTLVMPSPSQLDPHVMDQALPTVRIDSDVHGDLETIIHSPNTNLVLNLGRILRQRAKEDANDKHVRFSVLDTRGKEVSSISYSKLYSRALKVAQTLRERCSDSNEPVALVFKQEEMIEFLVSMFGCFYAGHPAVPIVPSSVHVDDEISELLFIFEACKIQVALSTDSTIKQLNKIFSSQDRHLPKSVQWCKTNEFGMFHTSNGIAGFRSRESSVVDDPAWLDFTSLNPQEGLACIEYTKNLAGDLKAVVITHDMLMRNVSILKNEVEKRTSAGILNMLEPRHISGLVFSFLGMVINKPVYFCADGTAVVPGAWSTIVTKYKPSVVVMEGSTGFQLAQSHSAFAQQSSRKSNSPLIDLSSLNLCLISTIIPYEKFGKLLESVFTPFGLSRNIIQPLFALTEFGFALATHVPTYVNNKNDSPEASKTGNVGIYLDCRAFRSGKVCVTGYAGDEIVHYPNSPPFEIYLTDVGRIINEVSVAIVNPNSGALLPSDRIGEIWISGAHLPKALWALPKLTEKTLHAHPTLNLFGDAKPPTDFPVSVLPQSRPGPQTGTCIITYDYVRTGLYGFVVTKHQIPHLEEGESRLFVVGHAQDRLLLHRFDAPNNVVDSRPSTNQAGSSLSLQSWQSSSNINAGNADTHFSNLILRSIFSEVPGLNAGIFFNQAILNQTVVVAVFDTSRTDFPPLAAKIGMILKEKHDLRPFAIVFCPPKSLPRLDVSAPSGTSITSTVRHYASLEIFETPPTPPSLVISDETGMIHGHLFAPPLDVATIVALWQQGTLPIRHCSLNGTDAVIGGVFVPSNFESISSPSSSVAAAQVVGGMSDIPILDDKTKHDLRHFGNIIDLILWRADIAASSQALSLLDGRGRDVKSVSFGKLSMKAHDVAVLLSEKHSLKPGDHVILMFTPSLEYYYCLWACFYLGLVPIPLSPLDMNRLREDLPSLMKLAQELHVEAILVNTFVEEEIGSRAVISMLKSLCEQSPGSVERPRISPMGSPFISPLPTIINTSKAGKVQKLLSKTDPLFFKQIESHKVAIIWVSFCPDATRTLVKVSHQALLEQCRLQTIAGKMVRSTIPGIDANTRSTSVPPTSRPFLTCLKESHGLDFLYSAVMGVYIGTCTYILPYPEFFATPAVWFEAIDRYRVKDVVISQSMLGYALKITESNEIHSFSLHNLESLLIPGHGRIQYEFYKSITRTLLPNRLSDRSISTTYGASINPFIATRGYTNSEPTILWVDMEALAQGKIHVLKEARGEHRILAEEQTLSGNFVRLQESGRIPNNTIVAIVDPKTRKLCRPDQVGEIWVCSPGNIDGLSADINQDNLSCQVEGVDPLLRFARTGDRGFLWPVPADGIEAHAMMLGTQSRPTGWNGLVLQGVPYEMVLFVVGAMTNEIRVNNRIHCCEDVERSVERAHSSLIPNSSVVFQTDQGKVVVAVETHVPELMPNAFHAIITHVLCTHRLLIETICFLKPGMTAKSRLNEKQRKRVAAAFRISKLPVLDIYHVLRQEPMLIRGPQ